MSCDLFGWVSRLETSGLQKLSQWTEDPSENVLSGGERVHLVVDSSFWGGFRGILHMCKSVFSSSNQAISGSKIMLTA